MGRSFRAEIKENARINKDHFLLSFVPLEDSPEPEPGQGPLPGQFYMVGVPGVQDPLLKRPFCYFSKSDGSLRILYRVKGKGTNILKDMERGSVLDVLGPLGNPYPMPHKAETALVLAGGIGIASLFPLIEKLRDKAHVIYGARSASELLMADELRALAGELVICTDDGSYPGEGGHKGTVLNLMEDVSTEDKVIYSCGPGAMLRAVSELALERGIRGYISLEERMACGIGACLGCAVKTTSGYKRVCKEGPVFKIGEVVWEREG